MATKWMQVVVASARDPAPRQRLDVNKPELRRGLVLAALQRGEGSAEVQYTVAQPEALDRAVELGVMTPEIMDFFRTVHSAWRSAPSPEENFASAETQEKDGLVPNFFVRDRPEMASPWARRLAWHCTDVFTPIYSDLQDQLADDLGVVERAVELVVATEAHAIYALTTLPGHHACADHYGGYCFVNHAALAMAMLKKAGRKPFLIDVDYHAGDGTANLLGGGEAAASVMCSVHATDDYPYVPKDEPWGLSLAPGAMWERDYKGLLETALARRPADCDTLVLSLGYDALQDDPCAAPGHAAALVSADFGAIRQVLHATRLPLIAFQEGGYNLDLLPDAAAAFWEAGRADAHP